MCGSDYIVDFVIARNELWPYVSASPVSKGRTVVLPWLTERNDSTNTNFLISGNYFTHKTMALIAPIWAIHYFIICAMREVIPITPFHQ